MPVPDYFQQAVNARIVLFIIYVWGFFIFFFFIVSIFFSLSLQLFG